MGGRGRHDLNAALTAARAGDPDGVAGLYRALASPLLSYLRTQVRRWDDAEDLLAQAFLEAVRDIRRFSGDAGGFRAWLFRIAHNRAIDLARRQSRSPEAPLEDAADRVAPERVEDEAMAAEERARLWGAVRALPPDQRAAVTLRLAGGLSSREIASVLGKRLGAIKALQHRALQNLARALAGLREPTPTPDPSPPAGRRPGATRAGPRPKARPYPERPARRFTEQGRKGISEWL